MNDIPIHPEKGLDPHMLYCSVCKTESTGLTIGHLQKAVDGQGNTLGYFNRGNRPKELRGYEVQDVDEYEKIYSGICDSCSAEMQERQKEYKEMVTNGGVYIQCAECGMGGAMGRSEFTLHFKENNGYKEDQEVGIQFDTCKEHELIGINKPAS